MGMDLAGIGALVQGIGNTASQGVNIVDAIDRMRRSALARQDPNFYALINSALQGYNNMPYGGPFGDPTTGFGGALGYHQDGTPIQPGEQNAQQIAQFLQNNPANTAMQTLNTASQMLRPTSQSFGDMFSGNPSGGSAASPQVHPSPAPMPVQALPPPPVAAPTQLPNPRPNPGSPLTASPPDNSALMALIQQRMQGQNQPQGQQPPPQPQGSQYRNPQTYGRPQSGGWSGGMRSYAVGTSFVPQTGPALLHQGEAVIPKAMNPYAQVRQTLRGIQTQQQPQPTAAPAPGTAAANPQRPIGTAIQKAMSQRAKTASAAPTGNQQVAQTQATQTAAPAVGSSGTPVTTTLPAQTPLPAQVPVTGSQPYDTNQGRVDILNGLAQNPMSFTPQIQQQIMSGLTDTANLGLQSQLRGINEDAAARGLTQSGIPIANAQNAYDARNANLMGANRELSTQAALQNFQDRGNVANLLMGQQLGFGNAAMQHQQMLNDQFERDRNYNTTLAGLQNDLGQSGQNWQQQLFGNLMNQGANAGQYQNNMLSYLMNMLQFPYRSVDQPSQLQPFNVQYQQPQQQRDSTTNGVLGALGTLGGAWIGARA